MKNKEVIVLGSGMSILDLSQDEIDYINQCEVIISVNKFMAFYKQSGIIPTHSYFVDNYETSNRFFLGYIFDICRKDNLKGLTFILNREISYLKRVLIENIVVFKAKRLLQLLKYGKNMDFSYPFLIPRKCKFEFIEHQDWLAGDCWATDLNEPLFHFRGSLTTVLNYISIKFPYYTIKLVGNDFNSPRYFFQESLDKLAFEWKDWTTPIVSKNKKHFSAVEYNGTTIFDKFDFIVENLNRTGNSLYSCNRNSLLVEKGAVEYRPVQS